MFNNQRDKASEYTLLQLMRRDTWAQDGDGPGHYQRRCEVCRDVFYAAHRDARFCDRRCYEWAYRNPPKECPRCGASFQNSRRKWCSDSCRVLACRERQMATEPESPPTKKPAEFPWTAEDILRVFGL